MIRRRVVRGFTSILISALVGCAPASMPESPPPAPAIGVLIMAHGGSDEWNATVRSAVQPIEAEFPTAIAFGMADPGTLQAAVDSLEAARVTRIVVVRLFVSSASFLRRTEYLFGLSEEPPARSLKDRSRTLDPLRLNAAVAISNEGLSQSPRAGKVIADRVSALSSDPAEEVILILAHGMADDRINDGLHRDIDRLADSVRALGPFRRVVVETLREDWQPGRVVAENRIRDFVNQESESGHRVIVVPFRVAGFGPYREVLDGTDYVSDGLGLLPHREITSWIRDQIDRLLLRLGRPTGGHQ